MPLFVEKLRAGQRAFSSAVIEGTVLQSRIAVVGPPEFKQYWREVPASFFEEVKEAAGPPRMLPGDDDAQKMHELDSILKRYRA